MSLRIRWLGAFLSSLASLAGTSAAQAPIAHQVAAPASDITSGVVRLPDPRDAATTSYATMLPLRFERTELGDWAAQVRFPVERAGSLALALLAPATDGWRLLVGVDGAQLRSLDDVFVPQRAVGFASDILPGWVIDRRDLHGTPAGSWTLRVETQAQTAPADGWLLASTGSELRIETFVTTQQLVAGEPIGIAARASGDVASIDRARAVLALGGEERELVLRDDGEHDDGAANDGWFGAFVPQELVGDVSARVELAGKTNAGRAFLRSVQVAFPVLAPRLVLDGSARATLLDDEHLGIAIHALPLDLPMRLHVSAEVWGRDATGRAVPVCWLSRMTPPNVTANAWELPLSLDLRWLDVARVVAPLELRAVRVQDPDAEVVLASVERIDLSTPPLPSSSSGALQPITPEMLTGSSATLLGNGGAIGPFGEYADTQRKRALMLVHGYCSSGSIWPAADFTQPKLEFLDPNANRTHDQFAQLIAQRAQAAGLGSFGIVGHSQGGPASLHLLTYYESGLDRSLGARRIQSVAGPYQGTPLASLGSFACGVNNDMTPSGAATWLAGIPTWARQQVFTWTTSNSGSACNFFTGLLLTDPEDGTVEKIRGELPGGNNMGHVVGWCHTTGMSNPASYTDHSRNQAMNAAAAR